MYPHESTGRRNFRIVSDTFIQTLIGKKNNLSGEYLSLQEITWGENWIGVMTGVRFIQLISILPNRAG